MVKRYLKPAAMVTIAAMLTVVGLTGCGSDKKSNVSPNNAQKSTAEQSTTLAPAKVKWLLRIPSQKDGDAVLAEVNKTLKEKINTTLEIQFIDAASYAEKTKLIIAAGEEYDIMFTSPGYNFYDNIAKNAYIPMDDLLKKYAPKAFAQIPINFWDATKVNGKIFGFPNYQIAARQSTITIRKDMAEKYGINMKDITTYEQFEPALAKMKAGEGSDKYIFGAPGITGLEAMNYLGIETIGTEGTPGVIEIDGSDYKIINQYEYPKFVSLVKLYRSWQEKGYINKDLSLAKNFDELCKNGKVLSMPQPYKPGAEAETLARYGFDPVYAYLTKPYVSTTSVAATMQAISKTSKNPERAMMLLEVVNTDKKLYNTLVYGLEDKHYKKTGENSIEVIANSGYSTNVAWMIGNQLNAYLLPGVASDIPKKVDDMNRSSKVSRIMGFSFNAEPVKSEMAQCQTVTTKYMTGFAYGMFDVDSTLATMNKELKAAGMDKVMAEKQKQLDEWVKANKK